MFPSFIHRAGVLAVCCAALVLPARADDASDINAQFRAGQTAEAFAKLAHVDSLTGLPNRLTFMQLLDRAYKRAQRDGTSLALLFLDLDGLKEINDTFGHGALQQPRRAVCGAG